jgi:YidC/Oxa1 family membrane protein insertase
MISAIFGPTVYQPLYNSLVWLIGIIPTHDVGFAVIALTIVVRIIIYPLARRAVQTQLKMKEIAPEIEEIKKKHKKNSPEQSQAILALYKERGVHPFSTFLITLVQLPILIALYWIFARGGLPNIDTALLYHVVPVPPSVNMEFLGFVNMGASHNIILAALTAITQFAYTRLTMGSRGKESPTEATLSGDMAKSFDIQARYVFPILIAVIAYSVAAAAPLYYTTSNLFMLGQEYLAGRRFRDR